MFTGPVGPVEVFFYCPEAVSGNFYWPGAIGSPLASSPVFFNAYILPHFDYCNTIWGHSSSEIQTRMLKLQKKAARYILDVDYSHPSRGLFKTLKWLPFLNRVQFNTAILMYKSVNGQSPIYLKNMFQFCSD